MSALNALFFLPAHAMPALLGCFFPLIFLSNAMVPAQADAGSVCYKASTLTRLLPWPTFRGWSSGASLYSFWAHTLHSHPVTMDHK